MYGTSLSTGNTVDSHAYVFGSDLNQDTGHPDWEFSDLHFLPNPFQFFSHPTIWHDSLSIENILK
jgi:hypothetical protein